MTDPDPEITGEGGGGRGGHPDPEITGEGGGGRGGHPDPEITGEGGQSQKNVFRPSGPQFGLKIRPGPSPESAAEISSCLRLSCDCI